MRVLLIEDEPTTAKSIELILGTEGFNVYTTDGREEAASCGAPVVETEDLPLTQVQPPFRA